MRFNWSALSIVLLGAVLYAAPAGAQSGKLDPRTAAQNLGGGSTADCLKAVGVLARTDGLQDMQVGSQIVEALSRRQDKCRKQIFQLVMQKPLQEAESVYLEEVRKNAHGFAPLAAENLGVIGASRTVDALMDIYAKTKDQNLKQGILRGWTYMPDARMVGTLIDTLSLDADKNPISLHAYSCEILGDIALAKPEALDKTARAKLVRGLFIANDVGQSVGRKCGRAVQKLGPDAVPTLIATFRGQNKYVEALLARYNTPPRFLFPDNHEKVVVAMGLSSLRSPAAVDLFLKSLRKKRSAPSSLPGALRVNWIVREGQTLEQMLLGLGDIGDPTAAPFLAEVARGKYVGEEWNDVTDWMVELHLRQSAIEALVQIGARKHRKALLDVARQGKVEGIEKQAKALEEAGRPMEEVQRRQLNWMAAKAFAELSKGTKKDAAAMQQLVDSASDQELKAKLASFEPMLALAQKCLAKKSDAKSAACFAVRLDDDDRLVRRKAALELRRLPAAVAGPLLAKHLDTDYLDTREVISAGIYHAPTRAALAAVEATLDAERDTRNGRRRLSHHRLELLRAWLINHFEDHEEMTDE